jgi:hypothetical protein
MMGGEVRRKMAHFGASFTFINDETYSILPSTRTHLCIPSCVWLQQGWPKTLRAKHREYNQSLSLHYGLLVHAGSCCRIVHNCGQNTGQSLPVFGKKTMNNRD